MKIYKGTGTGATVFYQEIDNASLNAMVDSLTNDLNQNHYTKAEVMNLIASSRSIVQVATMPANPTRNTLYYVGTQSPYQTKLVDSNGNIVDMGTSEVDLSDYVAKTSIATSFSSSSTNDQVAGAKAVYDYTMPTDATNSLTYTFLNANWGILNNDISLLKIAPNVYYFKATFVTQNYTAPANTELRILSELQISNRRPYATVLNAISVTDTSPIGCTYNGAGALYVNITHPADVTRIRVSGLLII